MKTFTNRMKHFHGGGVVNPNLLNKRNLCLGFILTSLLLSGMPVKAASEVTTNGVITDPNSSNNATEGQTVPITVSVPSTSINVTLPASIELVFDGSSPNAIVANNYTITNNSKVGILKAYSNAWIKNKSWDFGPDDKESYYSSLPLDSKKIYLGISVDNKYWTWTRNTNGESFKLNPSSVLDGSNSSQFYIKGMTGGASSAIDTDIVNLGFTFAYQLDGEYDVVYTLSLDANGGTDVSPMEFPNGGTIALLFRDSSEEFFSYKDGYILSGWSTEKNGLVIETNMFVMPNKNTTLYAQWTELVSITVPSKNPDYGDRVYSVPKGMSWKEAIESNSIYENDPGYEYYHTNVFTINDKNHVVFDDGDQHCAMAGIDINDPFGDIIGQYCAVRE